MKRFAILAALLLCAPSLAQEATEADPIAECDRLASHGYDPDRAAPGVGSSEMDIGAAILACSKAVEAEPGNPRLLYQLARSMEYGGLGPLALEPLRASADRGYAQSMFVLGYLYSIGRSAPLEPCRAAGLWRATVPTGHFWTKVFLGEALLDGSFDTCHAAPTPEFIRPLLDQAIAQAQSDPAYADGLEQAESLKARFLERYGAGD